MMNIPCLFPNCLTHGPCLPTKKMGTSPPPPPWKGNGRMRRQDSPAQAAPTSEGEAEPQPEAFTSPENTVPGPSWQSIHPPPPTVVGGLQTQQEKRFHSEEPETDSRRWGQAWGRGGPCLWGGSVHLGRWQSRRPGW